jgi:hypothetical protein
VATDGPEHGSAGDRRRSRARDAATAAAAAGPSAARWLVPVEDAERPVEVDAVADVLALDPRTRLRGRGDANLRTLAGHLAGLVEAGAVAPSGRPLVEVLVADPSARGALAPSFDLDALLGDGPVRGTGHDRTVRLAEALLERAAAHRAGAVDLHAEVAPVGLGRHPNADEVETLVRVATDRLPVVGGPDPASVVATGGWLGVSPLELFLTAARGLLEGTARDVGGAVLAAWLGRARDGEVDAWWMGLVSRIPVDVTALLDDAAAQAGSDHPDVLGAVLVERIAGRYPIAPPPG